MPLKKSVGNMYPWVTHTHSQLGGQCQHLCSYCYIDNPRWGRPERYKGEIRIITKERYVQYGSGKTIFIENCNDLFAMRVKDHLILEVLRHCEDYPENTYVFQTKNPERYQDYIPFMRGHLKKFILGTTIETNRDISISKAPSPEERKNAMVAINHKENVDMFVTIEPVLDFDVEILAGWIRDISPKFLNLGADSKNHGLPEPSFEKIVEFTARLKEFGIELREKHNLQRLKTGDRT